MTIEVLEVDAYDRSSASVEAQLASRFDFPVVRDIKPTHDGRWLVTLEKGSIQ